MGVQTSKQRNLLIQEPPITSSDDDAASSESTSALDIKIEDLHTFTIVCLDPCFDGESEEQKLLQQLRPNCVRIETFDKIKLCELYLKNYSGKNKILFLVSCTLGKIILPLIHHMVPIVAIYIYCSKQDCLMATYQIYSKVHQIFFNRDNIVQQISNDIKYFENIEDSNGIRIFRNRPTNSCVYDNTNEVFISFKLLIEILTSPRVFQSNNSYDELIENIFGLYPTNDDVRKLVEDFKRSYRTQPAIQWLTNNTPLAHFLNKALREQNISMMFYLQFFIIGIYEQIKIHQSARVHGYKKQLMSLQAIETLKRSQSHYVVFNGFLLISNQRPELLPANIVNKQFQTVIIEIHAENKDGTTPFACIQNMIDLNNDSDNSSAIFMCGSVFKIITFTQSNDLNCTFKLELVPDNELKMLGAKKQKLRETNDFLIIADLLEQSNQQDKADIFCQHLQRKLPTNHPLMPQIFRRTNQDAQPLKLNTVHFIIVDLRQRLSAPALALFNALHRLTKDCLLVYDNNEELNFSALSHAPVYLFTSSQFMSSMKIIPNLPMHTYTLEEDKNRNDQSHQFTDSEDLIFKLADELIYFLDLEGKEALKIGDDSTAQRKIDLANRIHPELKNVSKELPENNDYDESLICTKLKLVFLQLNSENQNNQEYLEKLLDIFPDSLTFFDANACHCCLITDEWESDIFLITDGSDDNPDIAGLQQMHNVKQVYYYGHSSTSHNMIYDNGKNIYFNVIYDMMTHHSDLGKKFQEKNNVEKANEMIEKAAELCRFLKI